MFVVCFFLLLFNFTLLTNPLSGLLRQSASASVHWKTSFVCIYVFLCCFVCFWTVDTKVVLTAAILFSRYSPLTMTEWELLTKPLQWCYTRPQQQPPQWRLFSTCHKSKSNLIGPKQQLSLSLCVPTVSLFLPFSLSHLLFSFFFPTLSLSIFSTSLCLAVFSLSLSLSAVLLSLYLSGPFRHSDSNSGK